MLAALNTAQDLKAVSGANPVREREGPVIIAQDTILDLPAPRHRQNMTLCMNVRAKECPLWGLL